MVKQTLTGGSDGFPADGGHFPADVWDVAADVSKFPADTLISSAESRALLLMSASFLLMVNISLLKFSDGLTLDVSVQPLLTLLFRNSESLRYKSEKRLGAQSP